jgi:hypothetical protein
MGKSCLHFRTVDDLPPATMAVVIASMTPDTLIALYEKARAAYRKAGKGRKK